MTASHPECGASRRPCGVASESSIRSEVEEARRGETLLECLCSLLLGAGARTVVGPDTAAA